MFTNVVITYYPLIVVIGFYRFVYYSMKCEENCLHVRNIRRLYFDFRVDVHRITGLNGPSLSEFRLKSMHTLGKSSNHLETYRYVVVNTKRCHEWTPHRYRIVCLLNSKAVSDRLYVASGHVVSSLSGSASTFSPAQLFHPIITLTM